MEKQGLVGGRWVVAIVEAGVPSRRPQRHGKCIEPPNPSCRSRRWLDWKFARKPCSRRRLSRPNDDKRLDPCCCCCCCCEAHLRVQSLGWVTRLLRQPSTVSWMRRRWFNHSWALGSLWRGGERGTSSKKSDDHGRVSAADVNSAGSLPENLPNPIHGFATRTNVHTSPINLSTVYR